MNGALWGSVSAAGWGTADFMARFSTRALDARSAYAFVLLIGSLVLTVWVFATGLSLTWSWPGLGLALFHGISIPLMSVLLYAGLARGPVSLVAPIVAAHPVLVVLFHVALGQRPGGLDWLAMAAVVIGVLLIARGAEASEPVSEAPAHEQTARGARSKRNTTIAIAVGACIAYAALILSGQAAVPYLGEVQTTWLGRLIGLSVLLLLFAVRSERPNWPLRWLPFLCLQGLLDMAGYLALLAGSHGHDPAITAVVASTFGVVTVLLARVVLKETIKGLQWAALVLVFGGVAVLAGHA
ncbi:MAG: DMT family transporter [Pseudomonadota bacterium]